MKQLWTVIALIMASWALPAASALNIFACTPEWGALAKELGGARTTVYVATTALQDPHRIEARPSLIAAARRADLVVCTGAELEVGWLPLVQAQSGNANIQSGRSGYFEAANHAELLERPERRDRAAGDVHAAGNPHLHLDPRNVGRVAMAMSERMAQLDPAEAAQYRGSAQAFLDRWHGATARWEKAAAPLKGLPIVIHHRNLSYLISWLGMREVGALEPRPGLPPTAAHLNELLARLAREPARAVVRAAYNDPRPGDWLAERARIPAVVLPFTVGGSARAQDLFGLFDDTLARLLEVVR